MAEISNIIMVDYWKVVRALREALEPDSVEFWAVVCELDKAMPELAWHNALTDG